MANSQQPMAENIFEALLQKVFKKQLKGVINKDTTIYRATQLTQALTEGYGKTLADVDYNTPDFEMLRQLQANVWLFSAAADYQMVKDLSLALVAPDGTQRNFSQFKQAANLIGNTYNKTRLQVEYNHAVATSQMASNWVGYQQNKDIAPNLKYQTVGDDRVRQAHRALNNIIKPIDDTFWDTYYPPNDWGCRCDVQAVDNEPTEVKTALPIIPKLFAVNLAKTGVLFPDGHPYFENSKALVATLTVAAIAIIPTELEVVKKTLLKETLKTVFNEVKKTESGVIKTKRFGDVLINKIGLEKTQNITRGIYQNQIDALNEVKNLKKHLDDYDGEIILEPVNNPTKAKNKPSIQGYVTITTQKGDFTIALEKHKALEQDFKFYYIKKVTNTQGRD